MILRIFVGIGLFALGYYLGREIGRTESVRDQLRWAREGAERAPAKAVAASRVSPVRRPASG